ncbi:MAG: hypothetical protein JWN46_3124 [Acidimicrobiales bacterium]|nr:hypothetical protein [Acidimicrobiales bacterium]
MPPSPDAPPAAEPPPLGEPDAQAVAQVRAMLQVTEQTRTYPCPQCGDQYRFDAAIQALLCPSCGNRADIVIDPSLSRTDHDLATTMAALRQVLASQTGPDLNDKEVVCQNCGGHTTFTGTLTATRCPYCATPIQRDDVQDAPTRLPVDGVLPLKVDEQQARTQLEDWVNHRWFAPSEFKKYKTAGSFTSIYCSFFTYDAETDTWYQGQRGEHYTVTVGSGDDEHTETRTRWYSASGQVHDSFDDVAQLANTGFDDNKIGALEPWPTAQALPYTGEFLAGHLCRTYDYDAEAAFQLAQPRIDSAIDSTIRADIGGDEQRIDRKETRYNLLTFQHLLLPLWLLTVTFDGKPFQVFINGVTGEVQGQRPWSKVKIIAAVIAALIVIGIVLAIYAATKHKTGTGR